MNLDPAVVFRVANGVALLGWVLLVASPARVRWAPAARRIAGRWLPLGFALVYVPMLALHWPAGGGFGSLAEVQALMASPGALVAGWLHYLAFDLFVGAWIAGRAAEFGWPHALLVPVLLLTFLFGPAGLLAYALWRAATRAGGRMPAAGEAA